jgi:anti-sigma factor RsiW
MKKLSNDTLMDYLDGTLDTARRAEVEAHLAVNPEDAALVADMKAAVSALQEWDKAEPVAVSNDFWIGVRNQLPDKPGRNPLRTLGTQIGQWLWPAQSPLRLSTRIAAIAVFVALGMAMFSPREATKSLMAEGLSDADKTFINQSVSRHTAYVSTQPLSNGLNFSVNDGRDGDGDGEDEEEGEGEGSGSYTP